MKVHHGVGFFVKCSGVEKDFPIDLGEAKEEVPAETEIKNRDMECDVLVTGWHVRKPEERDEEK